MGTFFLIAGTVLFFSGLGCLLIVFVGIARRLKDNMTTSVYFRSKRSYRTWVLSIAGVLLIAMSQGSYWFYNQVRRFIPFETNVPRAQISFLYEELRQPRMIIQSTDQNNQLSVQRVPFTSDSVAVGVEVIRWKKICQVLGLKDCYRVNGIYYVSGSEDSTGALTRIPNHELNGGPSGFLSAASALGDAFPGKVRLVMSKPIETAGNYVYTLQISPDAVISTRSIDNQQAINYPR